MVSTASNLNSTMDIPTLRVGTKETAEFYASVQMGEDIVIGVNPLLLNAAKSKTLRRKGSDRATQNEVCGDRVLVCFSVERPERPLLQANRIAYAGLCEFDQLSCDHCRQDVSPVNKPKRLQHVLKDGTQSGNLCGLKALLSFEKFGAWHTRAAQNCSIRTARVFRKDGVHGPTPVTLGHNAPASFDKAELRVCSKLTIFKFQTEPPKLSIRFAGT
jgi:hypothetical protein